MDMVWEGQGVFCIMLYIMKKSYNCLRIILWALKNTLLSAFLNITSILITAP